MEMMIIGLGKRDSVEWMDYLNAKTKGARALMELGERMYKSAEKLEDSDPDNPKVQELYNRSFVIMEAASELPH